MTLVGLDIGHGRNTFPSEGKGIYKNGVGYAEFDFNNALGKQIKAHLEHHGINVFLSQPFDADDTPLTTRTNKLNAAKVDLVVSIHANYNSDPAVNGICTFRWHTDKKGAELANLFIANVKKAGYKTHGDGLHISEPDSWTNLHMVRETVAPAVLIEHGFMDGKEDFHLIFGDKKERYIADMAIANAAAICEYFGVEFKTETSLPPEKTLQPYVGHNGTWKALEVGDSVTIRENATRWLNANFSQMELMAKDYTGTKDEIAEVKAVKIGYSNRAYKLKKLKVWILEQDLEEPRQAPKALYKVQTGAFSDPDNAKKRAAELKDQGVDTYIVKE